MIKNTYVTWPRLPSNDCILAVGAHFDDIEIGCGGALAAMVASGCRVVMLVLTKSEFSTKKYSRTAATAWNEGIAGAKELGISDVRTAGLSSVAWDAAAVGKIDAIIEEVRPSMVLGHWPFDTHQDHHNASWATLSSCRRIKTIMAYEPMAPSGRGFVPFRPQVYFDISSSIDKKKAAIAAHASQMEKYGEEWVEAAIARAKTHGWAAGVAYAEVFELARMVV